MLPHRGEQHLTMRCTAVGPVASRQWSRHPPGRAIGSADWLKLVSTVALTNEGKLLV